MEFLGRGGMGIVMRGYDTSLNRHSAVKVLAPQLATSAAARKRFSREAKSAAAVVHPHVVPIQTVDEHNGLPYLVMPVVEGQSVDARVRNSGPLTVIEAVRIASQIADGLAAAHAQGLVHRDIKPANVLLENGVERVQITDFGLARAIDDASMTRSGVIAGTPQYMSPEQAHGDSIDHRSDLFSLGSLIYFMLTGHSPFRAETTMGVLNRIGNEQPRSLRSINSDIPEWFEQIVTKLLAKPREDRFQTAAEVAELLQRWHVHLQQPDIVQPPQKLDRESTPVARAGRSRSGLAKWLVVTAAFGFLAFAGFLIVLELDKGTLTIESEADDVPIRIMQGNEVVKQLTVTKKGTSIRVASGKYVVVIDGDFSDIDVESGAVTLGRGGTHAVRIVQSAERPETVANADRKLTSAELEGVLTPEQVLTHGQQLSKYKDAPVTMRFRVRSVAKQVRYANSDPLWYLCSSDEPSELGVGFLKVWISPAAEAALKERGIADIQKYFVGKKVTITGQVLAAAVIIYGQPSSWTYSIELEAIDHLSVLEVPVQPLNRTASAQAYADLLSNASSPQVPGIPSPTPVRTLVEHVQWFNRKTQTAENDAAQPPLTVDELLCFAQWKLQTEDQLSVEVKNLLTDIGIGRWLPEGWTIEVGESSMETTDGAIRVYRIQLVNRISDTRVVVRERFLSPPAGHLASATTTATAEDTATPLSEAITEFNAMHNQVDGLRQPPLTLEEVLAAIVDWKSRRGEVPADNKTFANLQEIAKTHRLPADAKIEVLPSFQSASGDKFKIWSVRIVLPHATTSLSTTAFTIREQYLSVNSALDSEIHWGKPNDEGLQAGFRLIPGQRAYQKGQAIETEFFYRSILGKSISVSLPNIFSHQELTARDAEGKDLDVVEVRDMTVGGAMQTQVGETPLSKRGKLLELGTITPDPQFDSLSPRYTYLTVKDGQKVFLTYVVSDLDGGNLHTGEVVIDIAATSPTAPH